MGTNRSGKPVEGVDETYPREEMNSVLRVSDYLVIACPLTDDTRGMIGADELATLPRGAFLVNIARGEVVDEAALVAALRAGHLSGAGLDVFETEPLPAESPLWNIPGVLLTPHVAGRQSRAAEAGMERFLANLQMYREGKPLQWRVDCERGY
ncbi:MAG: NAD(P)-dependent oxidoreductase [Clostridia bacterium]